MQGIVDTEVKLSAITVSYPQPPHWRTYETVFNPCIIETQAEYIKSLADGDLRKAQWIGHRGVIAFWATLLKQLPIVRQIWTLSRG